MATTCNIVYTSHNWDGTATRARQLPRPDIPSTSVIDAIQFVGLLRVLYRLFSSPPHHPTTGADHIDHRRQHGFLRVVEDQLRLAAVSVDGHRLCRGAVD